MWNRGLPPPPPPGVGWWGWRWTWNCGSMHLTPPPTPTRLNPPHPSRGCCILLPHKRQTVDIPNRNMLICQNDKKGVLQTASYTACNQAIFSSAGKKKKKKTAGRKKKQNKKREGKKKSGGFRLKTAHFIDTLHPL